ncbi:unnamed protein product [Staurois parvus]|uniref:Uncharacterized protein n=1 Tax=Staurois parvus TaxID=386267 RepID=A0ABN9DMA9_9NEOB|nr:unnamed protein product [Staurois parvus]
MDEQLNTVEQKVVLKRTIGFFSAVNFIFAVILGTGIFVSPGAVLLLSQLNVGVSLVIWTVCGIISMIGALCYAELGTTFPSSGGEYYYIKRALGSIPAYIFLWCSVIFLRPAVINRSSIDVCGIHYAAIFPSMLFTRSHKKTHSYLSDFNCRDH